ncbi:helix-turn-helix domain-containing protein [Tundrisphaera sp. TA3]|uniref:helix-turn-helix domain-containing protein n=1 Tax=Tundrisphaera sp. TA3 TaxID=3435775 RepID=UPI003EB7ECB6
MQTTADGFEPLLTPAQVSEILNVDVLTLKAWRTEKRGPGWVKLGGVQNSPVRYPSSRVAEYIRGLPESPSE